MQLFFRGEVYRSYPPNITLASAKLSPCITLGGVYDKFMRKTIVRSCFNPFIVPNNQISNDKVFLHDRIEKWICAPICIYVDIRLIF